jgi:hypothetical protein
MKCGASSTVMYSAPDAETPRRTSTRQSVSAAYRARVCEEFLHAVRGGPARRARRAASLGRPAAPTGPPERAVMKRSPGQPEPSHSATEEVGRNVRMSDASLMLTSILLALACPLHRSAYRQIKSIKI